MSVANSVISATDLELFKNLANPAKVDIRQNLQNTQLTKPDIPPSTIDGKDDPSDHGHRSRSNSRHSSQRQSRSPKQSPKRSDGGSPQRTTRRDSSHSYGASSVPVSPPPSSDGSSRRSESPRRKRNSREPLRSSLKQPSFHQRSPRRSPSPPQERSSNNDFNPFRPSTSTIPAFYSNTQHRRPTTTTTTSIFDRETQKYLREDSPRRPGFKLPYGDRGPDMKIPPVSSRSRLFSPNPLDRPNLLDSVMSPSRNKDRSKDQSRDKDRSRDKHSRSRDRHRHHSRSHRRRHHSRSHSQNEDDELTRQEKRKYLLDLEKLRLQGVRLTKDYSMNDSIVDIRFEYDSHRSNYDIVDSINFMKDILGFSFTLVESLNQRLGPFLQLNGWSSYMKKNMTRFDRLLERAYHRFWRQGQPSPFMEFGMLVFGSMIMWHLQNKYLNGLPVGEMLGVMGSGGSNSNMMGSMMGNMMGNNTNSNSAGDRNQASDAGGGTGGGNGFSLGNILRMFTGGNANRPSPVQAMPSANPSMPAIIPPVPSINNGGNVNTRPVSTSRPNLTVASSTNASVPVNNTSNASNTNTRTAVPPSGTAPNLPGLTATLPPMNVRGITSPPSNLNTVASSQPPVRRMLRRPSAQLRDSTAPRPLSPVSETTQENDIPSPP